MKIIFTLLLQFIKWVAGFFLTFADITVSNVFPDFSQLVADWYGWVETYIGQGFVYFFHLLPNGVQGLLILYLILLGIFFTVSIALHSAIKVIEIIKNVKIW